MRFDNILFPVDFSESCSALKAEVEWIAKRFNSNVTLLHVFEIPPAWYGMSDACVMNAEWITEMVGEAKKRLDTFQLDLPADKVTRVSMDGQPAAEIRQWIRQHPVDLVMMAAHGYGTIEGLVMGSVTAKVLHSVSAPVWIHPAKAFTAERQAKLRIVCGIDFQQESVVLLQYAKKLAEAFAAIVTLVHSVPEQETHPNKYFKSEPFGVLVGLAKEEIAALQARAGTNFTVQVTGYPVSHGLAEAAAEDEANLILIGRGHSQKVLGRFRTHTYDLLGKANCPVLSFSQEKAQVAVDRDPKVIAVAV